MLLLKMNTWLAISGMLVLGALLPLQAAAQGQPTPAFMQPEVMQAALDIKLTDEQKPLFLQAVSTFTSKRGKAIQSLLRKRSQTDLPRKIRGKTNVLLKKMDKSMFEFLTQEQKPAYEAYRTKLKANLQGG